MTLSVREQILAAIETSLGTVAGVTVFRNRDDELGINEMPALVMLDGGQTVADRETGGDDYTLRFSVEINATAATAATLGPAASDLWALLTQTLAALAVSAGFCALASVMRQTSMADPAIGREGQSKSFAVFEAFFEVDYSTAEADPYN